MFKFGIEIKRKLINHFNNIFAIEHIKLHEITTSQYVQH